ncbi:MAG TPA: DNA polymerase III subunit gamma/tau [Solirubrobacteraceae bacterium]|nr:DNA polymerase III subunit gamma/tau [Solirubrobacteraceae bacterium]
MSSGPSLYRRHRPRSFADVVGQEHVVRTLSNAIEHGKVHHAYLFVGSRGTGKTSMAKILAACLNCVEGPTVKPCGVCESCVSIANATSLDVIEMDAASNNSVDDIRELREAVAYAPVSGRSKVYILDEAHMLSSAAWNAFLKTLEEPPPNTVFVLATTEAAKVLPTVVDRCHRFDFTRPTVEQLTKVVRRVAEQESIQIGADAVGLIARHATGSFRDALGTLEQLVTYSGTTIAMEDVLAVLGVADADLVFGALDAVAAHDPKSALLAIARLGESGRDMGGFMRDLEGHARELLIVHTLGSVPAEIAITPDRDQRLAEQAARVTDADVVRLLDLLATAMKAVKDGADARTQLELALTKAASPEVDPTTRALQARIERLEQALAGNAPPPPAPAPVVSVPAVDPPPMPPGTPQPRAEEEPARAPVAPPEAAPQPRSTAVAEVPAGGLELATVTELWPAVVDAIRVDDDVLAMCLTEATPVDCAERSLVIAFHPDDTMRRRKADSARARQVVAEALRNLTGVAPQISVEARAIDTAVAEAPPADPEAELLERLKAEFDAEEILDDPDDPEGAA